MIIVNGKQMSWQRDLTFSGIYEFLGYTLKDPIVTVKVNGKLVSKEERGAFKIHDNSEIEIINILRGG